MKSWIDSLKSVFREYCFLYMLLCLDAGLQLRHHLVQQTLGNILSEAGINHVVQCSHLCLTGDDTLGPGGAYGLSRLVDILL